MNVDSYFADFPEVITEEEGIHNSKGIRFRASVIKRRPSRHREFDSIRELGSCLVSGVLERKAMSGNILFVFPERHMAMFEQQKFINDLIENPTASEINQVDIITSSPMIAGSFLREQIRVLTFGDDNG